MKGTTAIAALTGLTFGALTSALNHLPVLGFVAAVVGSGPGWVLAGMAFAVGLRRQHPAMNFSVRTGVTTVCYLFAVAAYYTCDWGFALPGMLRLRDAVAAGSIPDPGAIGLGPDVGEWVLWSVASVPAALLAVGLAEVLPAAHPRERERSRPDGSMDASL